MSSIAKFYAILTQSQKKTVIEDASDEIAVRFKWYMEALEEATGLRTLTPDERLAEYNKRPPETWAALQQAFPKEYTEQRKDEADIVGRQWERSMRTPRGVPALPNLGLAARLTPSGT